MKEALKQGNYVNMSQSKSFSKDTPQLNLEGSTRIFQPDNGIDSGMFVS